jgi:hypothetical protein
MNKKIKPEKIVLPIHFEDRPGSEFERLCFAYICNIKTWISIDWYGQLGSDQGRDIWAVAGDDYGEAETYCYQCANHRSLKFNKAKEDIDKVTAGPSEIPDNFILITGGKVSADMKERVTIYAKSKGIKSAEVWTGIEFEEKLRRDTPSLIRRFFEGEVFPESPSDLKAFSVEVAAITDQEILSLFAQCFDRPAFRTPFKGESSVPAFKQAITDTIEVLNTGIHRLRDGTVIRRIPSRHNIQGKEAKQILSRIIGKLIGLRSRFDQFISTKEIKPCECTVPDCPIYMSSAMASRAMDQMRKQILDLFRTVYPDLDSTIGEQFA